MRFRKRLGVRLVAAAVGIVACGLVIASVTEPKPLVGEDRDHNPEVEAYREAEVKLFEHYGVDARSRSLDIERPPLRVHVMEMPGEGTPIVMLHGGGSSLTSWMPLLPELRGRHVFLVDRPGCGQTDGFDYAGVDLRRHAVDFVGSVLDALKLDHVLLVGNSMGGLWSLLYAKEHPERVDALALLGCPATFLGTSAPPPLRIATLPGVGAFMMRFGPSDVEAQKKMFAHIAGAHAASLLDPDLATSAFLAGRIPGAARSFRSLVANALTLTGARQGGFTDDDLAAVKASILLVWGRGDAFGDPSVGERARNTHNNIRLHLVDGGHLPWIDQPKEVGDIVQAFFDHH